MKFSYQWPALVLFAFVLAGCATQPSYNKLNPAESFAFVEFHPTPEQRQKLAQIKLDLDSSRDPSAAHKAKMALASSGLIDVDPDAARMMLGLTGRGDLDFNRYISERSTRTLVTNGDIEYIKKYWANWVRQQRATGGGVPWYKESFAIPAMSWVAEFQQGTEVAAFAQKELCLFWRAGVVDPESLAAQGLAGVLKNLGSGPREDLVDRYFNLYASNRNKSLTMGNVISLAGIIGDYYYRSNKYKSAAMFYGKVVSLGDIGLSDYQKSLLPEVSEKIFRRLRSHEFRSSSASDQRRLMDRWIGSAISESANVTNDIIKKARSRLVIIDASGHLNNDKF